MKQPITIRSLGQAQEIIQAALKKKKIRKLAYIGQRASDYLMLKDIVPVDAIISLDYGKDAELIGKKTPLISLEKKYGIRKQWYSDKIADLFKDSDTQREVEKLLPRGSGILPYCSTPVLEGIAAARGWQILSAPSSMRDGIENKINVLKIKEWLGLPNCNTLVADAATLSFASLAGTFGERFVVQTGAGSSGSGTHIVHTEETWQSVRRIVGAQPLLVAPFLSCPVISVNAAITPRQVIILPPAVTVAGNDETAPRKTVFSGVDFSATSDVPQGMIDSIKDSARKVGECMRQKGYRGAFNLDFLGERDGVLTDINARLMGSGPLTVEMQLVLGEIPFTLIHLLAFLDVDFVIGEGMIDRIASPKEGAFIVLHSLESEDAVVNGDVSLGYYCTEDMSFSREGVEYKHIGKNEVLVGSAIPQKGKTIEPEAPLLRIFSKERVLGSNFLLNDWYKMFCKKIYATLDVV